MQFITMALLLLVIFFAYVVLTYKKLVMQHKQLEILLLEINKKQKELKNTDILRREYNAIIRAYNHTLSSYIGKYLSKKLMYVKKEIIEKI